VVEGHLELVPLLAERVEDRQTEVEEDQEEAGVLQPWVLSLLQ